MCGAKVLLLAPTGRAPVADVVAIPDCNNTPEQLVGLSAGIPEESQFARRLAESGCRVIVPVLINRENVFDPQTGTIQQLSNREWAYRQAYEMGRGLIGYEVQKVLALVDWLRRMPAARKDRSIGWGKEDCWHYIAARSTAALPPFARVAISTIAMIFGKNQLIGMYLAFWNNSAMPNWPA